jgi:hypothetical protein
MMGLFADMGPPAEMYQQSIAECNLFWANSNPHPQVRQNPVPKFIVCLGGSVMVIAIDLKPF